MERKLRITVDGRPYIVTVEELGDSGNQLYPQPGTMTVPMSAIVAPAATAAPHAAAPAAVAHATAAPASAGPGDVQASLGGVVESVSVAVGQAVAQGDTIVVLEAMKMRSPMIAPRAGTVTAIHVKAGDAVEAGHVLATLA